MEVTYFLLNCGAIGRLDLLLSQQSNAKDFGQVNGCNDMFEMYQAIHLVIHMNSLTDWVKDMCLQL